MSDVKVFAAPQNIQTEQYCREGASGEFSVKLDNTNRVTFNVETVNSHGHICTMSGTIHGEIGHADSWSDDGSDSNCDISILAKGSSVVISPITPDSCLIYCGQGVVVYGKYSSAMCRNEKYEIQEQEIRNRFPPAEDDDVSRRVQ